MESNGVGEVNSLRRMTKSPVPATIKLSLVEAVIKALIVT